MIKTIIKSISLDVKQAEWIKQNNYSLSKIVKESIDNNKDFQEFKLRN